MIKRIKCTVSEEYILGAGECIGRVGSHDETALELEFRDNWAGLSKTLFWTNADGTNGTMQILTPDMLQGGLETYLAPVPYGAKTRAGRAKLTIRGVMVEGERETVCAVAEGEFEVKQAEMPEDYRDQLDIDATAAEQIMAGIEEIKGSIADAIQGAADAKEAAQTAETAAGNAERAADKAEGYTDNPPKPVDGMWQLWDGEKYVPSNEPSRGEMGPEGKPGESGANVKNIALEPDGEIDFGGDGTPGKDGLTPYIKDGNWWIGETDTGVKAAGTDGKDGVSVVSATLVQTE